MKMSRGQNEQRSEEGKERSRGNEGEKDKRPEEGKERQIGRTQNQVMLLLHSSLP